jgi:thioredoxin-related protein
LFNNHFSCGIASNAFYYVISLSNSKQHYTIMKKILGLLLATTILGSTYAQQAKTASLPVGSGFPEGKYNITDVYTGGNYSLRDLKTDKGLLVIFTCNTCPFVIRNIDRTKEILAFAKEKGIGVMLVNSNEAQRTDVDAPEKMAAYGREQGYPNYLVDADAALADAFGASHTPEVYLFDGKTEKLVYKGAMDDSPADPKSATKIYLKDAMNNLVAGTAIAPSETKSVGCSIKRIKK